MLRTRLWMGAILILLTLGVLLLDSRFAPWYPFLFVQILGLSLVACHELLSLLGAARRPWPWLCYLAVVALLVVNWLPHVGALPGDPLHWVLGSYVGVVLAAFVVAMAYFQPAPVADAPGSPDTLSQVALTIFIAAYLGLLPTFLVQLRWLLPDERAIFAVAMAIFVPKCCDIGAYTTGRLFGRHKMAPILSPKKTWEGLAGGFVFAAAVAVALNQAAGGEEKGLLTVSAAVGFGLTVGGAGVLGDLAESLIKRECRQKDASQAVPGFGGVLDVVDSILYAAPVAYVWLA